MHSTSSRDSQTPNNDADVSRCRRTSENIGGRPAGRSFRLVVLVVGSHRRPQGACGQPRTTSWGTTGNLPSDELDSAVCGRAPPQHATRDRKKELPRRSEEPPSPASMETFHADIPHSHP